MLLLKTSNRQKQREWYGESSSPILTHKLVLCLSKSIFIYIPLLEDYFEYM